MISEKPAFVAFPSWKGLVIGFMGWVLLAGGSGGQAASISFSASIEDGVLLKSVSGGNLNGEVRFGVFWDGQSTSSPNFLTATGVSNLWSSTSASQRFSTLQAAFLSLTTSLVSVTNGTFAFSGTADNEYDTGVDDGQGGTILISMRDAPIFAFVADSFSSPTGVAILGSDFAKVGDENGLSNGSTNWGLAFNGVTDEWGTTDPTAVAVIGTPSGSPITSIQASSVPSSGGATLSVTGVLGSLVTTYGNPSSAQSVTIAGTSLTGAVIATAPAGFEVSSNGTTYASTASFTPSGGSVSGTISVRLAATAPATGTYNSQNIVVSSTGATSVNIATTASGNSVAAKALTIGGLTSASKDFDGTTTATVTGTPFYVGLSNGETFAVSGSVSWAFPNAAVGTSKTLSRSGSYSTPSANYTVTQPVLTADIRALPTLRLLSLGSPVFTNGNTIITHTFAGNSNATYVFEYKSSLASVWQTNAVSVISGTNFSVTFTNSGVNSTNDWKNRMFFRVKNG